MEYKYTNIPKELPGITKRWGNYHQEEKCDKIDCLDEYIGESSGTFGERSKEHLKAPSPNFEHQDNTGHTTSVENFKIIGREGHNMARAIKEAIYLTGNNPTLNGNMENTTCHVFLIEFCTPSQNWK